MSKSRPKSRRQYVLQNDAPVLAAKLPGAVISQHPKFIAPSLATLSDKVPSSANWVHEIEFDGYRLQLHKRQNEINAFTRRGHDWAGRFQSIVTALWRLQVFDIVLDGEVIVPTKAGTLTSGRLRVI